MAVFNSLKSRCTDPGNRVGERIFSHGKED